MQIQCISCKTAFELDQSLIGAVGRKMRCAFCHTVFFVTPQDLGLDPDDCEHDPDTDPNLYGTMVLSLRNKPRQVAEPGVRYVSSSPPRAGAYEARTVLNGGGGKPVMPPKGQLRKVLLSPSKMAALIRQNKWTQGMQPEEINVLHHYLTLVFVPQDTFIFHKGDDESFMCWVVKGQVQIINADAPSHSKQILTIINPGHAFGELGLIDGQPRAASAFASKDSYLLLLAQKQLEAMMEENPRALATMLYRIAQDMTRRLRDLSRMEADFIRQ